MKIFDAVMRFLFMCFTLVLMSTFVKDRSYISILACALAIAALYAKLPLKGVATRWLAAVSLVLAGIGASL